MKPLLPPESHHLSAASGWLGLGRTLEADEELQHIAPQNAAHPDVLEVRWQINAKAGRWAASLDIAESMIKISPNRAGSWIHRSQALHALKRTEEALDTLRSVSERFHHVWTVSYALSCYCAQLGRFIESQLWLRKAMNIDKEAVRKKALSDPNLKMLWQSMSGKNIIQTFALDTSKKAPTTAAGPPQLALPEVKRF